MSEVATGAKGGALWRHRDFLRLWAGQTVALFGAQVTLLALPLTAMQLLDASAGQLGLLNALEYLPVACVTLLAGVLADRVRRRPLLIAANLGRALMLAVIPVMAWTDGLSMGLLYTVAFVTGLFTAQFDVAYQAYLPSLIERRLLVEGNSKLQSSQSIAQTAGQGLSGVLIQLLTAPVAVVVNSAGYLVSVVSLLLIRSPEPVRTAPRRSVRAEIAEGFRVTMAQPVLRVVMAESAWFNLLWDVVLVVVPIYGVRELHLGAAGLGLVIAAGSVGAFGGSLVARRLGDRLGSGRAMTAGMLLASAALVLLPLAGGPTWQVVAVLTAGFVLNGFGMTVFNVHSVALRQALVATELTGRVSATFRFAAFAVIPVGGFLGGLLAGWLGARAALAVVVAGLLAGAVVFYGSRTVRLAVAGTDEPLSVPRPREPVEA
ncbi:MFS transporter [Kitasatospora sp. MMS16-BH015]|uniref:MFS transporter n=1 Tax=Kitasatospora sp. MMS16-BH015 TaxID=2018025 RepID=UPI000CA23BCB|nr:MFS transporter [Kitasatospora sp. MMS16-BH015]AUG80414.1 MFS transporter [Kitasatospora sp. MMS16-BH015]